MFQSFRKVEDLVDDHSASEQDWEDYDTQLMEELLHKEKRYPYHHPVYESLTRSEVLQLVIIHQIILMTAAQILYMGVR